ncbi:MAG: HEAT repeat domain-containing protein [Deltaproteobacteria bacterium]
MTTDALHEGAPGDAGLDEEEQAARQAADVFFLLLKGIKNINIYRHAETRFAEYLEPAHQALTTFLEAHDILPLKLTPYTLEFKKHVIYQDEDRENLTYRFYKDGMRYLMFRKGMPPEELLRFVMLATERRSDAALFQEDMITRLWKEQFEFIEYVVVEGFGFGDLSEEEVEIEVEKIVAYLRKQLSANSDDITRFARLSAEDLELELTDVDQMRGGIISGRTATDGDRAQVQEELFQEAKKRLFAKMVLILFQILELECDVDDYEMMLEAFTQVLDTLLVSEDVKGAVALLQRFEKIAERPLPKGRIQLVTKMGGVFRRRMAEPHRLDSVGQYLMLNRDLDEGAVHAYLSVCGEEELLHLVEMLAGMERQDARAIMINVLAELGRSHVDVFARRLDHNSSNVVKDMLAIIHKINPDNKIQLISRCLDHPNIMIRLEGLKTLAKSKEDISLRYIEKAMRDEDIQMRVGAYRALATRAPKRAAPLFVKAMQADDFLQRDNRERIAIATALGETRSEVALDYLKSLFTQKGGLFSRGKANDMKSMAVIGLAAMKNVSAFKVLAAQVQNRDNPKEVMESAHKAALRLKQEIKAKRAEAKKHG